MATGEMRQQAGLGTQIPASEWKHCEPSSKLEEDDSKRGTPTL